VSLLWIVGGVVAWLLLWKLAPGFRPLLFLGALSGGAVWWFRKRSYPEGRSKAQGSAPELEQYARELEEWLLEPLERLNTDRQEWEVYTRWQEKTEQCASGGQSGLLGSTVTRVEATSSGVLLPVELRPGATLEQARAAAGPLESAMRSLPPGTITASQDPERAGRVLLKIRLVAPEQEPTSWPGAPEDASITKPAEIGAYLDGGGALLVPLRGEVVLVGGIRGSGKSGVVNALVGYLTACRDAALWGVDLKRGVELKPWRPVFQRLATTLPEVEELLLDAVVLMDQRLDELAGSGRLWSPSPFKPALVVVVDEQSLVKESREAIDALEKLAVLGRAAGITLILATQYPTKESIGSSVLVEQVTVAVGLRVRTPLSSRVLFGEDAKQAGWAPHAIAGGPGHLYLRTPDLNVPKLARAWHVTDEKVTEMVRHYRDRRPSLVVTPRPGSAAQPRGGGVPTHDTNRGEPDGSDGGEAAILAELPARLDDLADRLDTPRTTLYRRLVRLRDVGQVENRDGLWWAVP
jgi:hypothetical protein